MLRLTLFALSLGAVAMIAEADEPKEPKKVDPRKIDPRFNERVTVRRFFKGNKDTDGKPLEFINPDKDVPAYRREVKGETKFFIESFLEHPRPGSEVIDAAGNVWEVKTSAEMSAVKYVDENGKTTPIRAMPLVVTLKKKAPEKK